MIMNLIIMIIKYFVKKIKGNRPEVQTQELGTPGDAKEKDYLSLVKKLCGIYIKMKTRTGEINK